MSFFQYRNELVCSMYNKETRLLKMNRGEHLKGMFERGVLILSFTNSLIYKQI